MKSKGKFMTAIAGEIRGKTVRRLLSQTLQAWKGWRRIKLQYKPVDRIVQASGPCSSLPGRCLACRDHCPMGFCL